MEGVLSLNQTRNTLISILKALYWLKHRSGHARDHHLGPHFTIFLFVCYCMCMLPPSIALGSTLGGKNHVSTPRYKTINQSKTLIIKFIDSLSHMPKGMVRLTCLRKLRELVLKDAKLVLLIVWKTFYL